MRLPKVSCIMPTSDRINFVAQAIKYFSHIKYQNKELIILDDGTEPIKRLINNSYSIIYLYTENINLLGDKRNICCENASGDIIVHFDDDDWYSPDWITRQVNELITSKKAICGLKDVNYISIITGEKWNYIDTKNDSSWAYGGTLAYWRNLWLSCPFGEMNTGEDNDFIFKNSDNLHVHDYTEGYLGRIHNTNAGIRMHEDPKEKLLLSKWIKPINSPFKTTNLIYSNLDSPKVSCIMPTANREKFIQQAIRNFLAQDYNNKELIIIDDGIESVRHLVDIHLNIKYFYFKKSQKIGSKRNLACKIANGEIIMHWDDDDWYAPNWISFQVDSLNKTGVDICGLNQIQFFSPTLNKYWMLKNENSKRPWLSGQTLAYHKTFWEKHPFKDLQHGEDDDFVRNTGARIFAHGYYQGFVATLHANNTSNIIFPGQ